MKGNTHKWIAARALALLEQENAVPELVGLLKSNTGWALDGAHLPDYAGAGAFKNDTHIIKIMPMAKDNAGTYTHYVVERDDLKKRLGDHRDVCKLFDTWNAPQDWWATPYKGVLKQWQAGKHPANRAMSVALVLQDMLLLSNGCLPGIHCYDGPDCATLTPSLTTPQQAALQFFMLSHFVVDATVPCHCDGRATSRSKPDSLHDKLESFLDNDWVMAPVGAAPETNLSNDTIVNGLDKIDAKLGVQWPTTIPPLMDAKQADVWTEVMDICRGSFAVCAMLAPPDKYPYSDVAPVVFAESIDDPKFDPMLKAIMHDAVVNVAVVWKHVWEHRPGQPRTNE